MLADVGRWLFHRLPCGGYAERILTTPTCYQTRIWVENLRIWKIEGTLAVLRQNNLLDTFTKEDIWGIEEKDPRRMKILLGLNPVEFFTGELVEG